MTKHMLDFNLDMTWIITKRGEDTVRLSNFFVEGQSELTRLGHLPAVVRSISPRLKMFSDPNDHGYIVVVERKPQIRTLKIFNEEKNGSEIPFTLPIPWQHYFIVIREHNKSYNLHAVRMYYSSTALASLDHTFYIPYHPCVDEPDTMDFNLSNIDFFNSYQPEIEDYKFKPKYDEIYNVIWDCWDFNPKFIKTIHNFVEANGFSLDSDYDENSYLSTLLELEEISSIPFNQILDEKIFKALTPAFTFGDYLKHLDSVSGESPFDFKTAFNKALDAATVFQLPPEKLAPKRLKYAKAYTINVGDASITLNYNTGTTMTGQMITGGGYTTANTTATWIPSSTSSTWTPYSASSWLSDIAVIPKLYQDSKKRWRRMDGTFANKKEIEQMKNPFLVVNPA